MYITHLRKVGGSTMLAIPAAILDLLELKPGVSVGIDVEDGRLVIARRKRKYTLDELLAQCDPNAPFSEEDNEWLNAPPVGRELI